MVLLDINNAFNDKYLSGLLVHIFTAAGDAEGSAVKDIDFCGVQMKAGLIKCSFGFQYCVKREHVIEVVKVGAFGRERVTSSADWVHFEADCKEVALSVYEDMINTRGKFWGIENTCQEFAAKYCTALVDKFEVVDVDDNYPRCASDYIPIPVKEVSVSVTGTSS